MTQEHAPSFTHFHDYADYYDYTELERPDYSAFFYASLCAAGAVHRKLGHDRTAEWFQNLAARCAEAICEHLWDPKDKYFYSIRESDGEYARCREANGFFPFAFNAIPDEPDYHAAIGYLLDEDELFTPWPFGTVSRKCPAFSPHPEHWGEEKKKGECLWNGPTWPYTNSILTEAMGNIIRHHSQGLITAEILCAFVGKFARMMCEDSGGKSPLVREYYDGESGEGWGCPDYLHSSFNDLIIRFMCGLVPVEENELVIDPLCAGWSYFRLERLGYRGHEISIIYDTRPQGEGYDDIEPGLTVIVDGQIAAHEAELAPLTLALPEPEPEDEEAEPMAEDIESDNGAEDAETPE